VSEWKEYDQEELIAYFRNVVEDEIVWDRASKVDWIFNKRPVEEVQVEAVAEEEKSKDEKEGEPDVKGLRRLALGESEPRSDGSNAKVL